MVQGGDRYWAGEGAPVPPPMTPAIRVLVLHLAAKREPSRTPGQERSAHARHPWAFSPYITMYGRQAETM